MPTDDRRGVLVLDGSPNSRSGQGIFDAASIASWMRDEPPGAWLDIHGPDARELDAAIAEAGVAVRREERRETVDSPPLPLGTMKRWIVRYTVGVSPAVA